MRRLLRAQLRSRPANGHVAFVPHIRKLVFEYCDKWPSSTNTRTYILNHVQSLARKNPHVEVVVKQRNQKEPILRGFYGISPHVCFFLKRSHLLSQSQQQGQSHPSQCTPSQRHPKQSTTRSRLIRCKNSTSQTSDHRKHHRFNQGHLERSAC